MVDVRSVTAVDADEWHRMRCALWPLGDDLAAHRTAIDRFFAGDRREPLEVLIAVDEEGRAVGLAELSIRNIVDSCTSDRVSYLEGWYVDPQARRRGVGRALIEAAEAWGRKQGCDEFGSDSLIDNEISIEAHRALGFEETGRVCNFRKSLLS
jgi:aminoglycoside 6'-N-acetyltransferase I